MEGELLTVIIVVATALAFDFTNGFHETANVLPTSISTRAMAPRIAVGYAALLNFAGAFISLEVAATVASDVVDPGSISLLVVFGGLVGAIAWNLVTWYFGLPSSSSHALIGGIVGAMFVAEGPDSIFFGEGIGGKVMIPALVAPTLAFLVGGLSILLLYRIVGRLRPSPVTRGFRGGQVVSGGLLALAHGTNDAQKTMGVIALALVAYGSLRGGDPGVLARRLPALDHAHDLRRGDRRGRRQAALSGALGGGREHRRRVGPHAARRGGDRRPDLRRHAHLRHRRGGPGDRVDRDRGRVVLPVLEARAAERERSGAVRGMSFASIVDWDALLTVVWASVAAGIGVTAAYGLVILGATRAVDLRRDGRVGEAVLFGVVGVAGAVTVVAAIVLGIVVLSE